MGGAGISYISACREWNGNGGGDALFVLHSLMRLIVIGGGAAGFFCAVNAARLNPRLRVSIVEKSNKLLSKVRISGGGRCNVTHACFDIPQMAKSYPRGGNFVKKTFHEFFTTDTIEWFRQRGVMLKTEPDGRMFPVTDSSETIVNCLLQEAAKNRVEIFLHKEVKRLSRVREKNSDRWVVHFTNDDQEICDFVCIACGGYPKEAMFLWLKDCGHSIEVPVPSLFTFNIPGNEITRLMGVSTTARVKIAGSRFEEEGPVLITHWGLSGPAVLRLSARAARDLQVANYQFRVIVNWLPDSNEQLVLATIKELRNSSGGQKVSGKLFPQLPQRLWEYLCRISEVAENARWADIPARVQYNLARNLTGQELGVMGKTTYKEEFVTAGGIKLSEVNPATMESRKEKGLFFAGEILDVDGITGGFNFQHAWTSGWIAAKSIATASIAAGAEDAAAH